MDNDTAKVLGINSRMIDRLKHNLERTIIDTVTISDNLHKMIKDLKRQVTILTIVAASLTILIGLIIGGVI
jgi:hypothetical protein